MAERFGEVSLIPSARSCYPSSTSKWHRLASARH